MRNATRDLLRLSLTASVIAGILVYANFEASRGDSPEGAAMARTDSIRHVRTNSEDRFLAHPNIGQPRQVEPEPEIVTPADSMAKHSAKLRTVLALAD